MDYSDATLAGIPAFRVRRLLVKTLSASEVTSQAKRTRIPSGIWSRLYGSFPSAVNTWPKV